jgi:predicted metal-dependent phosphoesterase TrpH
MTHDGPRDGRGPEVADGPTAVLGRADLHVHSHWSDGMQSPELIIKAAAGRVDVLAITDHDEIRGALSGRDYALTHPELGVDVIVGEEISTLSGHVLALYLHERIPPRLTAARTIEMIHDQGGLAVAAHPFHPVSYRAIGHPPLMKLIPALPFDALEVVNNSGPFACLYDAWAARRNAEWMLALAGGSDAHDLRYVGSALTRFQGRDATALRRALVGRRTRAHLNWSWTVDKVPRQWLIKLYGYVRGPVRRMCPRLVGTRHQAR